MPSTWGKLGSRSPSRLVGRWCPRTSFLEHKCTVFKSTEVKAKPDIRMTFHFGSKYPESLTPYLDPLLIFALCRLGCFLRLFLVRFYYLVLERYWSFYVKEASRFSKFKARLKFYLIVKDEFASSVVLVQEVQVIQHGWVWKHEVHDLMAEETAELSHNLETKPGLIWGG